MQVLPTAIDLPPPEVVEGYSRTLGVAGAVVLLVIGYVYLRRRTADTDLVEHEKTKREMTLHLRELTALILEMLKEARSAVRRDRDGGGT